jgi:hypothetical protein
MVAGSRVYDFIGFGDEIPGIFALVAAGREFQRRMGRMPQSLLMFKGSSKDGVGGHLVRGKLAYLDRSQIHPDLRQSLGIPPFGDPCSLYKELLLRAGVNQIALDPARADLALRQMLSEANVSILSRVEIKSVIKEGNRLAAIQLVNGSLYSAGQFIDATVNSELAQAAGIPKQKGFGTFGLPESELPVTLVFETEGLTTGRLREAELSYFRRFSNPQDTQAQQFLNIAAGGEAALADRLRRNLFDRNGNPRIMYVGTDYIDVSSPALSIAYHSFRGKKLALAESGMTLDPANIALLPDGRMLWNSLLFAVTGTQAEALARDAARPTPAMLEEMTFVTRWLQSIGATTVRPAVELYVRHAGNILGTVDPIRGNQMMAGGVPSEEALATFAYHFDVRGGIPGLGNKASATGLRLPAFESPPIFNVGIRHAMLRAVPNLAVVSPGSGFGGYACATGRIVEFNSAVGQGLGIAATLAHLSQRNLADISNREVQDVLFNTGLLPRIYGFNSPPDASRLLAFEQKLGSIA